MKCMDCPLHYVMDVVSTCIILHNKCTLLKDDFDTSWIEEVEKKLQN
jgi:hypothetical protein